MPVILNEIAIQRKMKESLSRADKKEARDSAQEKAEKVAIRVSESLISALDKHKITLDLKSGPFEDSPFLSYGSLLGFFGLPRGDMIAALESFRALMLTYLVDVKKIRNSPQYNIKVQFPDVKAYYDAAPAPANYGDSWLKVMELGLLKNFSHFIDLVGIEKSRSGGGIQSKYVIKKRKAKTVPPLPYISDIYGKYFGRGGKAQKILANEIKRL